MSSSASIGHFSLEPGKWVVFGHDTVALSKSLQGPFKVIDCRDCIFDGYRCWLMNGQGKLFDYCPRECALNSKDLHWGYTVKVIKKETIEKKYKEIFESLQAQAIEHLKTLAQSKNFEVGFNPDNESETLTGQQIREKYGLALGDREV